MNRHQAIMIFICVTLMALLGTSQVWAESCESELLAASEVAAEEKGPSPEKLGRVHFPVSCSPAVREDFQRALAKLHSFWYEEALKAFTDITVRDPQCAMAYWGVAMSLYNPLWSPPSEATLKRGLDAVEKAKANGAKTARERDYIEAIGVFYKDSSKLDHRTRVLAYGKAMEGLYLRYTEDREAAVFYALALNASAPPTDKTYTMQKKAGEILERVFKEEPNHPGVTHYIIHSYDNPPMASQGLTAARRYAKIAPSVPHAQHMPSHIFTRLGLWEEAIQSNIGSGAASKDYAAKTHPGAEYAELLHAMDYLGYAYLQGADDRKAKGVLDELMAIQKVQPESFAAAYAFAAIPARYAIERRRWSDAASLTVHPSTFPWARFPWAEAVTHFVRALGAARSGDTAGARKDIERLQFLREALVKAKNSYWAGQVEIQRQAAVAWLARAEGKNEEALMLMRSAADQEDSTEKSPVTPGAIVPARELLGEMLLELGRPAEALKEFETSNRPAPNRFRGLYGAARAAELSGNGEKARAYYAKLVALSGKADSERPELLDAKTFLAKK